MCFYRVSLLIIQCAVLASCSQIAEDTRTVATATGGVIGAGVGAIIGSQTGNAGAGLALGAAAGTGVGLLIGDTLENNQVRARASDELINRRKAIIKTQRQEIESLRSINNSDSPIRFNNAKVIQKPLQKKSTRQSWNEKELTDNSFKKEKPIREVANKYREEYADGSVENTSSSEQSVSHASLHTGTQKFQSSECKSAEGEFYKGRGAVDSADKLLALRRAVRLCPSDMRFQLALGQAYKSAGRREDAVYQFKEVLKVEPNNPIAKQGLAEIR